MAASSNLYAWLALFAVYFFWGTTYLGIRMALESFPPVMLISVRFLVSGAIMLIVARLSGAVFPRGRELWRTAFNGVLMLGGGTGILIFAEMWVPSGLAALFITTSPFWFVGIEALLPGGEKLHPPTLIGIFIGFLGVAVLVGPSAFTGSGSDGIVSGFLLLQLGCLSWCLGSILQKRLQAKSHPLVNSAIQQFASGLVYLPVMLLLPEHPVHWTTRGTLALAWLITFGSIVGFSAFVYALEHLPVAVVSTYTYVNPMVACFLGWLFYREPFGVRELVAMIAVFTGVALVKYFSAKAPRTQPEPQAAKA